MSYSETEMGYMLKNNVYEAYDNRECLYFVDTYSPFGIKQGRIVEIWDIPNIYYLTQITRKCLVWYYYGNNNIGYHTNIRHVNSVYNNTINPKYSGTYVTIRTRKYRLVRRIIPIEFISRNKSDLLKFMNLMIECEIHEYTSIRSSSFSQDYYHILVDKLYKIRCENLLI